MPCRTDSIQLTSVFGWRVFCYTSTGGTCCNGFSLGKCLLMTLTSFGFFEYTLKLAKVLLLAWGGEPCFHPTFRSQLLDPWPSLAIHGPASRNYLLVQLQRKGLNYFKGRNAPWMPKQQSLKLFSKDIYWGAKATEQKDHTPPKSWGVPLSSTQSAQPWAPQS